jgi:TRAP-type C4-dicarboxylate transport system permease small subunit
MIERLTRWAGLAGGIAVVVVTLLVSYDVLMRYFLNEPQLFVDELAGFLQVAIIFLGLAYTFLSGGHVRVDLLTTLIHPRRRARLRVATLALGVALLLGVAWTTAEAVFTALDLGRVSAVMLYPLWLPMVLIPAGLLLLAAAMIWALVRQIRMLRVREIEPDEVPLNLDAS